MGDRVDLWGGLPDRPRPYFTHQRKGTRWDDRRARLTLDDSPPSRGGFTLPPAPPSIAARLAARATRRRRDRPVRRTGIGQVVVVAALAVAALVAWRLAPTRDGAVPRARLVFASRARGYEDSAHRWHRSLAVSGFLDRSAAADLADRLDAAGLAPGDLVVLSSPGGELEEGLETAREIRRRGLYTVVGALDAQGAFSPASCASACVLAFMGGVHRIDVVGSRLGVHQFRVAGAPRGADAVAAAQGVVGDLVAFAAEMGVSPDVVVLGSRVPPTSVHWLTPDEVASTGIATLSLPRL